MPSFWAYYQLCYGLCPLVSVAIPLVVAGQAVALCVFRSFAQPPKCAKYCMATYRGTWLATDQILILSTYKHSLCHLKTYAAISNAHLSHVCKRGKLSGSCLSTLNGSGSTQLPVFLCHIGVPTFSSQNNELKCVQNIY